jgi:hypothetical protein
MPESAATGFAAGLAAGLGDFEDMVFYALSVESKDFNTCKVTNLNEYSYSLYKGRGASDVIWYKDD